MGDQFTLPPALITAIEAFLVDEGPSILSEIEALLNQLDSTKVLRATRLLALRESLRAAVASLSAAPPAPSSPPAAV
jgi:hypothetical protein